MSAYPGGTYLPVTLGPFTLQSGTQLSGKDFVLRGADGLPPGTTIEPHTTYNGVVKVDTRQPLTLTHQNCPEATVPYTILVNGSVARQGLMSERTSERGIYSASVSPLTPLNGYVEVQISATCKPSEPPRESRFDLYIDPSGVVQNTDGKPLAGALVTLWRAESAEGRSSRCWTAAW